MNFSQASDREVRVVAAEFVVRLVENGSFYLAADFAWSHDCESRTLGRL